jgi:hypothetical protein
MRQRIRTARLSLLAVAVCAALGFGASTVLATPPQVCPRLAVDRCNSLADCQSTCAAIGSDPAGARCEQEGNGQGCCYCPLVF